MRLIIFGAGEQAELCHHYFTRYSDYTVEGFVIDAAYRTKPEFLGLLVLTPQEALETWPPDSHDMFVTIGYSDMNRHRHSKCEEMRRAGYRLTSFIHPTAIADCDEMGDNCLITENVVLSPKTKLGNGIFVRPNTYIGHHTEVADYVYIGPGVLVGGNCALGAFTYLGIGAVLRDAISIAEGTQIGMGSVVTKSIDDAGTYLGVPAKRIGDTP
ncbi:MAG: acetyltransferase [Pseudomonadota bacterium]